MVGAHHRHLFKLLEKAATTPNQRIIVNIAPRHGKACGHDTAVLTTKGWKKHGDLVPGDMVFHPSGKAIAVVRTFDEIDMDMEVETTSGEIIVCHSNHEWTVRDVVTDQIKTVETKWFVAAATTGPRVGQQKKLWFGSKGNRGARCHYQLPEVSTIEYEAQEVALNPYALGVWLGDGTQGDGLFCMGAEDMDQVLPAMGYNATRRYAHTTTGVNYARMELPFKYALKSVGVLNKKHIPEAYLRNTISTIINADTR